MIAYPNDLAAAVIVGATAFVGLAMVMAGQIKQSELTLSTKNRLAFLLGLSVAFGASATLLSIGFLGFKNANSSLPIISAMLLVLETYVCSSVALKIIFGSAEEKATSKPSTHRKSLQK